MQLFIPETGLLFWMLLAFGVVFFVLAKYGWPAIIGMVEKRSDFINDSVRASQEAHLQLENVKATSDEIISKAKKKQMEILQEASNLRDKILDEAKEQAQKDANKIYERAKLSIQKEKDEALKDIRKEVTMLSFEIAEKVVRQKLDGQQEQKELIDKLLNEMKISQS